MRYDGSTGAFIDEYASGGGLDQTHFLEFIPGHQVTVVAAPVLDLDADDSSTSAGADFNTSFTEDGGAVSIADVDATLSDADSTDLVSLLVTITNQLDGVAETLAADTPGTRQ